VVLAAEPGLAVSLVGVSARCGEGVLPRAIARQPGQADGSLLDRRDHGVFHFLHDPGILFDAGLPGAGLAYWRRNERGF